MAEVKAAIINKVKNIKPNRCPEGPILARTAGIVIKVRPGPAPGSKPKAKTAGKITKPANIATDVSLTTIYLAERGISSFTQVTTISNMQPIPKLEKRRPVLGSQKPSPLKLASTGFS